MDEEENIRNILKMLGDAPGDSVGMCETNAEKSAHIGELSVECLIANDCRGAVLEAVRAIYPLHSAEHLPTFTRYRTPADAVLRW